MSKSNEAKRYFPELDILSWPDEGIRELMRKMNFAYNQVDRLDNRIISMLNEPFNEMKWKNINEQRDKRQEEFELLSKAYEKKYENWKSTLKN